MPHAMPAALRYARAATLMSCLRAISLVAPAEMLPCLLLRCHVTAALRERRVRRAV